MGGRFRSGTSGIFPFRLGEQTIGFAGHFGQPSRIALGVVPAHIDHWLAAAPKAVVEDLRVAIAVGCTGVPLIECHFEFRHGKRRGDCYLVLWAFTVSPALFVRGRPHHEVAGRHDDHLGAVVGIGTFPECIPWLQRPLRSKAEHIGPNLRVPEPLSSQV